jgi:SSS family solute:Na+ symporter
LLVLLGVMRAGGLAEVVEENLAADPGRFVLIHNASHPVSPWPGVFTFWLTLSLWYVGTNQFYIQRCLGARTEWDARMGVIACAFVKFALPAIIVFPGLVAFALFGPGLQEDSVYVRMINTLLGRWPVGRGIMLAALVAAIMSTVSSVINSASTIWAMDVHRRVLRPEASEAELVRVGRWATFFTIVIGTALAPFLMWWEGGIFLYIQDMAAFLAPPVAVVFLAAFLWRPAHERSATFTLAFGILSGIVLKLLRSETGLQWLAPLLNRAAVNWAICAVVMLSATLLMHGDSSRSDPEAIWNRRWGRLPAAERHLNRGWRNITFWWVLLIAGSVALFVVFN